MRSRRRLVPSLPFVSAALVAAAALAGCGAPAGDAQVAAKVGKAEISIFQVAEALRRRQDLVGLPADEARRAAVEALIEQELAAQAARSEGLDKDPSVIQALELVKREFLARAYQDKLASQVHPPSEQVIEKFYVDNPARFAERKLYVLQEYAIASPPEATDVIEKLAETAANPDELTTRLRSTGAKVSTRRLAKAPEELTSTQIDALTAMTPGKAVVSRAADLVMVYWLVRTEAAPLDRTSATPIITATLLDSQRKAHIESWMEALRKRHPVEVAPLPSAAAAASAVTAMR